MFIFAVCQRGAEKALKAEVSRHHAELTLAYSRPGFVTFKSAKALTPDFRLQSVFARAYGLSLGRAKTDAEARALLAPHKPTLLHAFDVDDFFPGDEPEGFVFNSRSAASDLRPPKDGQLIGDVVSLAPTEFFAGLHVHHSGHTGWPGGRPPLSLPLSAPSRAYLKFEEARLLLGADLRPGQVSLEIGASPGGTALRILELGLNYVAVDPKPLNPQLKIHFPERFRQFPKALHFMKSAEWPKEVQWLLVDANLAPAEILPQLNPVLERYRQCLLGFFFTLKLNDWSLAPHIPEYEKLIRKMAGSRFRNLTQRQLCYNRQEIFCGGTCF